MDGKARATLAKLIADHGHSLCDDPRRCEALLRDLCGEHRREINVLIGALEEGVATDLRASQGGLPQEVLLARLTKRLRDNLGMAEYMARWAVETWGVALGALAETSASSSTDDSLRDVTAPPPTRSPVRGPAPSLPGRPLYWIVAAAALVTVVVLIALATGRSGTGNGNGPPPDVTVNPIATETSSVSGGTGADASPSTESTSTPVPTPTLPPGVILCSQGNELCHRFEEDGPRLADIFGDQSILGVELQGVEGATLFSEENLQGICESFASSGGIDFAISGWNPKSLGVGAECPAGVVLCSQGLELCHRFEADAPRLADTFGDQSILKVELYGYTAALFSQENYQERCADFRSSRRIDVAITWKPRSLRLDYPCP